MKSSLGVAICAVSAMVVLSCTGAVSSGSNPSSPTGGTSGAGPGMMGIGGVMTGTGSGGSGASGMATGTPAPIATPTIARLSQLQWANSVRDLLYLTSAGDLTLPTADAVVRLDNEADSLFVNQALHDDLQASAERLAAQIAGDATATGRLLPASAPADAVGRATAFIQTFGRRAYRRPLTSDEVQSFVTLFNQGPSLTTGLTAFAAGVRVTIEAFLQSPHFLYRTAFGGTAVQGRARLTDHEIAANIAYGLTNSIPDPPLSAAADQGIRTPDVIAVQAKRLIATAAGKSAVDRFYFQFFGLGQYDTLEKNPAVAPKFTSAVGPMLHAETQQFLQYVFGQNGTLRDMFTSPVTFVNSTVAGLYGLTGSFSPSTWTQVQLDPAQRPGVLTRLGFLAYHGHDGDIQDSIHRGAYINRRLLCKDMSPPPGVVLPTIPPPTGTNQTNRQIVNGITGPNTCGASCHGVFINPAGFAFENFDGLGAYHTMESGQVVDASGTYPFTEGPKSFANQVEFSKALADSQQLHSCHAVNWAANLYSRIPRAGDLAAAAVVAQSSLSQNISSADLIVALMTNDAFVTRVEAP
jgi:hypothetical protein